MIADGEIVPLIMNEGNFVFLMLFSFKYETMKYQQAKKMHYISREFKLYIT